jgi:hypothetical protein
MASSVVKPEMDENGGVLQRVRPYRQVLLKALIRHLNSTQASPLDEIKQDPEDVLTDDQEAYIDCSDDIFLSGNASIDQ